MVRSVLREWSGEARVTWTEVGLAPGVGDCACVEFHGCGHSWRVDTTVEDAPFYRVYVPAVYVTRVTQ